MEVGKLEVKIDVDITDVSAATLALDKLTDAAVRAADALDRLRCAGATCEQQYMTKEQYEEMISQAVQDIYNQRGVGRVMYKG